MKKMLVFFVGAILLACSAVMAAEKGVYLGAGLFYNKMLSHDFSYLDSAVGLDLRVGYNFGPVMLEGNLLGSTHDDGRSGYDTASFGGLTIDVKVPFLKPDRLNQPYLLVGLAGYSLTEKDPTTGSDVKLSGGGYDFGLGVEHRFNEHLALNLAAIYRGIKYDKSETGGTTTKLPEKLNGNTRSVDVSLNYYF
jgi:opacity protein-like surface antigen